MSGFKTFSVAAWLAVGGMTGIALIDSPAAGTQRANADGTKYFTKSSDAASRPGSGAKVTSPRSSRRAAACIRSNGTRNTERLEPARLPILNSTEGER